MEQKTVFPRTHISLNVSSIDATVEFYDKFFNTEAAKVEDRYAKYELDAPALTISFIENEKEIKANFGHLGIQVETKEELNDKLNLARGNKIVQLEEIETACCYAIQDKFWVQDPDGYEWEIYHFLDDVDQMGGRDGLDGEACCTPSENEEKESVCC